MKNIIILFLIFSHSNSVAQKPIEYRPNLPASYKDTLLIFGNDKEVSNLNDKVLSFKLKDENWDCKKIDFIYYLPKEKLRVIEYEDVIYKERNMDKRIIPKEKINNYRALSFYDLKRYSEENLGCNNLESYLLQPTLYYATKKNNKFTVYEVFPLVWGVKDD